MSAIYESYITGDNALSPAYGDQRICQTFTPQITHRLTRWDFLANKVGTVTGTGYIRIYATAAGVPTGAILAEGNFDVSTLVAYPTAAGWKQVTISPLTLTAGVVYAAVLDYTGGDASNYVAWWRDSSAATYTGGNYMVWLAGGSSWTQLSTQDLLFKDWGDTVYVVYVDWNNDGDFDDANENISDDVLMPIRFKRGRDEELGYASPGTLEFRVKNSDGKYSPENTGGALYGNLLPGRPIKVTATDQTSTYTLFKGRIEKYVPHPGKRNEEDCYIYATDGLAELAEDKIEAPSGGVYTNKLIGADPGPMETILDEAGWPVADRTLDAGVDTLQVWWAHKAESLSEVHKLEDLEKSFCYIDETGKFVYEDRHHRYGDNGGGATDHLTSQATFSDVMSAFDYESSARPVRNIALITGHKRAAIASDAKLWETADRPLVPASSSITIWAKFSNPVSSANAPAANTDWKANTASDGSGTDHTADVSIVMTLYGQSAKLVITNAWTGAVYIIPGTSNDALYIDGKEYEDDEVIARDEDATSQTAYGDRSIDVDVPFHGDFGVLQSYAEYLVRRYKDAVIDNPQMLVIASTDALKTQVLSRKISDRITVTCTDLGISAVDYFIEAMEHEISDGGALHKVIWTLSKVTVDRPWLLGVAGYSEIGETTYVVF